MISSYDQDMPHREPMAVDTQFMFTEGHIRLLIWMCDAHQDYLDRACDDILKQGDSPSDNLMNCREGIAELKIWAHRLLEALEEEEDEDEMGEPEEFSEINETELSKEELDDVREALDMRWRVHRNTARPPKHNPVQMLRAWLRSLL